MRKTQPWAALGWATKFHYLRISWIILFLEYKKHGKLGIYFLFLISMANWEYCMTTHLDKPKLLKLRTHWVRENAAWTLDVISTSLKLQPKISKTWPHFWIDSKITGNHHGNKSVLLIDNAHTYCIFQTNITQINFQSLKNEKKKEILINIRKQHCKEMSQRFYVNWTDKPAKVSAYYQNRFRTSYGQRSQLFLN